jgi:hypothetical protein
MSSLAEKVLEKYKPLVVKKIDDIHAHPSCKNNF